MPVRQPRRSILRALTAGVAGLSLSGTALGSSATGAGGGTASAGAGIEYTDVQENVTVENYEDYPGYTPTDRERRVRTSVVGHTGPQPIDGVPDWARQAVADAHEVWNGIGNWPDDAYLRPETDATRAEAAKYVYDSTH